MKKIFCGAVIALIGVIYSIALMVMATINNVYSGDAVPGLSQAPLFQQLLPLGNITLQ